MAALLLSYGADINAVETEWCSTPLGWAAKQGQKAMVEWLLENGSDINAKGPRYQPPVTYLVETLVPGCPTQIVIKPHNLCQSLPVEPEIHKYGLSGVFCIIFISHII